MNFETSLEHLNVSIKKLEHLRRSQIGTLTHSLFDIDLSIAKSRVFLYTNQDYSHITNRLELDSNENMKDIKMFSSYMHAKHLKTFEKFREVDNKLLDELKNIETIKAIDVEFDENVYLNIFDTL